MIVQEAFCECTRLPSAGPTGCCWCWYLFLDEFRGFIFCHLYAWDCTIQPHLGWEQGWRGILDGCSWAPSNLGVGGGEGNKAEGGLMAILSIWKGGDPHKDGSVCKAFCCLSLTIFTCNLLAKFHSAVHSLTPIRCSSGKAQNTCCLLNAILHLYCVVFRLCTCWKSIPHTDQWTPFYIAMFGIIPRDIC